MLGRNAEEPVGYNFPVVAQGLAKIFGSTILLTVLSNGS